jgi:hypothetical protein
MIGVGVRFSFLTLDPILVIKDEDRRTFIKTFEEAAEKTGWEVYCCPAKETENSLTSKHPG